MKLPFTLISLLVSPVAFANNFGDVNLGKVKSPSCVFCHSVTGNTTSSTYPNLAGQDPQYLLDAMLAYQNDQRKGPLADMMKAQLSRLNEQDLRDIAAFYAQQDPEQ